MKHKILIIGILISFGLVSCDCWIFLNGKIVDSETNEPLRNVKLEFLNVDSTYYIESTDSIAVNFVFMTDSIGHFSMNSNNYGICPDIDPKIKIWKKGYKMKEFILKDDTYRNELNEVTIKLEKE